jgi:hypothetical protein
MNRCRAFLLALTTAVLLAAPGCLGQFAMTSAVRKFNVETVNGKWPREILFIGLYIIPAYPISAFGDLFIVNAIEFWSEENPITGTKAITVTGE